MSHPESPPHKRDLIAMVQLAQLRERLGLVESLEPIALDPERRFLVLDILGVGGMGVVFLGHDTELDRRVALKLLRYRMLDLEQLEQRLRREAQLLAKLQDPNILVIYDIRRARSGELFLATQYISGPTLREWQCGRSFDNILDAYLDAGRGLAAAHEQGVVHRDFKPENVLIESGKPPKIFVSDFGLADGPVKGELGERARRAQLGTPTYMAPEQKRFEPATPYSDQYSFCVALWEACTGAAPSPATLERSPELPGWLHRLLTIGLSPRPGERHTSLVSLIEQIEAHRSRRRRAHRGGVAFAVLGLCLSVGYGLGSRPPSCDEKINAVEPWSRPVATTLQQDLASMPFEFAPKTGQAIIVGLEANVEARQALALATCEAQAREPKSEHVERRARCVERWRARTVEQITALGEVDAAHFADAYKLLYPLDELAELCRRGGGVAPLDAQVQDALTALENTSLLADHDRALDLGEAALALARDRGQPCLGLGGTSRERGYAHFRVARVHMRAGQSEIAREQFLRALQQAGSCEDVELEVNVDIHLGQLYALHLGDPDAAKSILAGIPGKLDALAEPQRSLRRAWLVETNGFIALAERRPLAAIPHYERALEVLGPVEEHPTHTARLWANIGAAQQEAGALEPARQASSRAREIVARTLGLGHPMTQTHLRWVELNEGLLSLAAGDFELAMQKIEPLMEVPEHPIRVRATSTWLLQVFDGDTTQAQLERTEFLLADLRAHPQLPPRVRAEGLTAAGHLLAGADESGGVDLLREALALWKEQFPNDPWTPATAIGLAEALSFAGRDDEARDACRSVRRLTVSLPPGGEVALERLERELGI